LVGSYPSDSAMYALGTERWTGSGAGTTAASAAAGCSMSTDSSSNGRGPGRYLLACRGGTTGQRVHADDEYAGKWPSHGARPHCGSQGFADQPSVSVWPKPSRMVRPPGLADLRNHFEVQRLPGADNLAQRPWTPERSPLMSIRHTVCGAQNTLIWWLRSTRGAPLPRTAHSGRRAPWPPLAMALKGTTRRACRSLQGDVQVHTPPGRQARPENGGQVSHGVRHLRVLDQLWSVVVVRRDVEQLLVPQRRPRMFDGADSRSQAAWR
jgi:hypothetical protein